MVFESPVLITLPELYVNEKEALEAMAASGADIIHFRKPVASRDDLERLLRRLDSGALKCLTVHYDTILAGEFRTGGVHDRKEVLAGIDSGFRKSASCHSLEEVSGMTGIADYVFLSPVFDSISKQGYKASFDPEDLRSGLKRGERPSVVALGGIKSENITVVKNMGFDGAALLGSVWVTDGDNIDIEKSVGNYIEIKKNGTK